MITQCQDLIITMGSAKKLWKWHECTWNEIIDTDSLALLIHQNQNEKVFKQISLQLYYANNFVN